MTAVVLEGRGVSEVVEAYGVSRSWVYELVARYRAGRRGVRGAVAKTATVTDSD
jgi:transposase